MDRASRRRRRARSRAPSARSAPARTAAIVSRELGRRRDRRRSRRARRRRRRRRGSRARRRGPGRPSVHTSANRSSWLSGSGNVPALPNGFCVATRKNGSGSGWVTPSTVTWCSSIGSSSAACVRGDARFTSSTSTTLAKIGPGRNSHSPVRRAVHRRAGDVGGQQVGRALHPPEAAADRGRERLGEQRLAGAGHALDEEVPAREQRDEREPHGVGRAAHRARDGVEQRRPATARGSREPPATGAIGSCMPKTRVGDRNTPANGAFSRALGRVGRVGRAEVGELQLDELRHQRGQPARAGRS